MNYYFISYTLPGDPRVWSVPIGVELSVALENANSMVDPLAGAPSCTIWAVALTEIQVVLPPTP